MATGATKDALTVTDRRGMLPVPPESGVAKIAHGSYVGDGTNKTIALPFDPALIVIERAATGTLHYSDVRTGNVGPGWWTPTSTSIATTTDAGDRPSIAAGGMFVRATNLNKSGETYYYTAIGA